MNLQMYGTSWETQTWHLIVGGCVTLVYPVQPVKSDLQRD